MKHTISNTSSQLNAPKWTFTSDSCGYMLFKDGLPQGGARTMGTRTHTEDGRRRHWKHIKADTRENRDRKNSQEVSPC